MTLIKSISGIRGTMGGKPGEGLTPLDIVKFSAAYARFVKERSKNKKIRIVIGRDARVSGPMVRNIIAGTIQAYGVDVIDLGLSTTPTVEIAVKEFSADGGIIITASHNPGQWNAMKLLNEQGEFLSADEGSEILNWAEKEDFIFVENSKLGKYIEDNTSIDRHIEMVLALPLVDAKAIKKANFKVAIDGVNSTGGIVLPRLLKALGVSDIEELFCKPDGIFPHNPEPLPENLEEIAEFVPKTKAHLGFVVDPDVDRLAIICEDGDMFGEEYTLVAVADYVLKNKKGNTVSNLSSTRALQDLTEKAGGKYFASAVGETNVVAMMKEKNAVIGGEGNGGVIYPELHYGRDALVGIALFLTYLAKSGKSCSALRNTYPDYFISKNKLELTPEINVDDILEKIRNKYKKQPISTVDGVRIDFDKQWVHIRKSNTEAIVRIYAESDSMTTADALARKMVNDIKEIINPEEE
jgi:phosphomannomutase